MAASAPPACASSLPAIGGSCRAVSSRRAFPGCSDFANHRSACSVGARLVCDGENCSRDRKAAIRVMGNKGGRRTRVRAAEGGNGTSEGGTSGSGMSGGETRKSESRDSGDSARRSGMGGGGERRDSGAGGTGAGGGFGGGGSGGEGEEGGGEGGKGASSSALIPLFNHLLARVNRATQFPAPPLLSALLHSADRLPPLLRTSATSGALLAGGDVCAQCIEVSSAGGGGSFAANTQMREMRGDIAEASHSRDAGPTLPTLSALPADSTREAAGNAPAPVPAPAPVLSPAPAVVSVDAAGFNPVRTARMMVYGACIYGPALHLWYPLVERVAPGRSVRATMCKVLASQALLNPCLIAAVFAFNYAGTGQLHALEGKYKQDFLRTWRRGWHFWLPVSFASFRLVPLHLRPAFSSTCSLLWNCHLSMVSMHKALRDVPSMFQDKRSSSASAALHTM